MAAAKKKVLIVEDEFILYDELVEFFEEKGYFVIKGEKPGKAVSSYDEAVKLMTTHKPDIAIVDINIEGDRDGLELCAYIKKYFKTLIVVLSAHANYENLERARSLAVDEFVIKADKPVNIKQLWINIFMALPKFSLTKGPQAARTLLGVKEMEIKAKSISESLKNNKEPIYIETFINWDNVTHIKSYNANVSHTNNHVLIYPRDETKTYLYRSTLKDILTLLPEYFDRFDNSTIVNLDLIDGKGRGTSNYYIGKTSFKLSDTYKTEVEQKINLIFSDKYNG